MKRYFIFFILVFFVFGVGIFEASAMDVDRYIKELKHSDPKVRANAAYELGCG